MAQDNGPIRVWSLARKGGHVGIKEASGWGEGQRVGSKGLVERTVCAPEGEKGVVTCWQV